MNINITTLSIADLDRFIPVFSQVLKSEFPGYTADVVQFFLEKVYTRSSFFYWLENKMKTVLVAHVIASDSEARYRTAPGEAIPLRSSSVTGIATSPLAPRNDKIIGFAVIDEPYGGVCFCRWLGILKKYQHQGAGSLLIKAWIDLVIKNNCHKAEVASQPEARVFYEKVGLELEGMRKLSYFGIDQYLFGKVLSVPKQEMMIK